MMRRSYGYKTRPFVPERQGFRSKFPSDFDDPFGERNYNWCFGGEDGPDEYSNENYEPSREAAYPHNEFEPVVDRRWSSGGFDRNNRFGGRPRDLMSLELDDPFNDLRNDYPGKYNNNNNWGRINYGRKNDGFDNGSPFQSQVERNPPQKFNQYQRTGFQMNNNTNNFNNKSNNDQQFMEPVKTNEVKQENETPQSFPVRTSTEISVPGWQPEIEEKPKTKIVEVQCKICNITLTSKGVYEVHIRGKKHMKREADAKNYSCELCCTQLFSAEEQQEHNETEEHKDSVKVAEFFKNQRKEDPDLIKKKQALASKQQPTFITQSEIDKIKAPATDLLKYRCDICNVNCNAQQMLELHMGSKKHIKKANELKMNSKSSAIQYSCETCQFLCYSSEEHEAHSNSEEHLKALSEKYKAGLITAPSVPLDVIAAGIPKDELDIVPERGPDNILWYNCKICDVKTNSLENYKMHINSKKHKTKVTQPGAQVVNKKAKYSSEALRNSYTRFVSGGGLGKKITGDPGSYCARCEIQFKTPQELEEHFLTLAHKNHNPYKKKLFFDNDTTSTATPAKKAKYNNGTPTPISGKVTTTNTPAAPVPTSDYGYATYDHLQPNSGYDSYGFQTSSSASYQPSSGYQTSSGYQSTGSYQGSSGYQTTTNYQSHSTYGYGTTQSNEYYPASGYASNYSATYSTDSQPRSYSYSAPYYQH